MKKALVLLLALCMMLTLCACGDASEKEFEAAKALYDAGDYENAIEALQSLNHYAEITDMIEDAQKQLAVENNGFLFTTWKGIAYESTLAFFEDGTCDVNGSPVQYSTENDKVTVAGILLDITQEDGIYLLNGLGVDDYVREEDYDRFIAEHMVELTLDNYLDYYEWDENRWERKDAYGNVCDLQIDHKLKLKAAYEDRVLESLSEIEVGYTWESLKYYGNNMQIDFETLEYSGGYPESFTYSETGTSVFSPACFSENYFLDENSYGMVSIYTAPEIVRVEGHLVIR